MRISAKADYALRAMAQIAAEPSGRPLHAEQIARQQGIPTRFLLSILGELKRARLLHAYRGTEGGYVLNRGAADITLADVIRIVDGPLVNLRDTRVGELGYSGPAAPLTDVWMAVRSSVRSVLESVTLAQLAGGRLPTEVTELARTYVHRDA